VRLTISIFGSTAALASGTAQDVQVATTATQATGYVADDLINSESDSEQLRQIGEIQPLPNASNG